MYFYAVLISNSLLCLLWFLHLGAEYGLVISVVDYGLFRPERVAGVRHRKADGEAVMTFYIIGAVAALLLMIYLVVALLKPELFS